MVSGQTPTDPAPLQMPSAAPASGDVVLRAFSLADDDVAMVEDLATDPYVPLIGSLDPDATRDQAVAYIERQHDRLASGAGFSFCIADRRRNAAVGGVGLWLRDLPAGRATVGYAIAPSARGRGYAAQAVSAVTAFGWTIPELHRIELYVESGNVASMRTAASAGYQREGLLRSHQRIGGHRVDMLLYATIRDDRR